jgi:tetratricopeptide (TPR) repeat protein
MMTAFFRSAMTLPNLTRLGYSFRMKRIAAFFVLLFAAGLLSALAQQSADDQYLNIYGAMQQADGLAGSGDLRAALAQYTGLQAQLQQFQDDFPDWNPKIVTFRLKYLAGKIADLTAQLPAPVPTNTVQNVPTLYVNIGGNYVSAATATNAVPVIPNGATEAELADLCGQIKALQSANTTLLAKLKEALGVQPAMVEASELTRAQEQIQALMKENDLLKADAAQAQNAPAVDTNALVQAQAQIEALTEENATLKAQAARPLPAPVVMVDTNSLFLAQTTLADVRQKLADETDRADKLSLENAALQTRVQSLLASPAALEALHEENAMLKNQLAALQTTATNAPEMDQLDAELKQARLQIAALQSDTQVKQLEKAALENRIQQLQMASTNADALPPETDQTDNEARISELTQERDDLLAKLGEANKQLYGTKKQDLVAQVNQSTDEIRTLRERLAVDEAQTVPYTPEELALFQQSAPQLSTGAAQQKSINEMPAGSAGLVDEAQNFFNAGQFDRAESDYLQILQQDENNALVLGNLAAIEMQEGKLESAEKHIKTALAQDPNDAFNLATLGYLKFRQEKYDEALDILSRAAKLDPQNPEILNYLGVTLSHKGLRTQAETALRKAIELNPDYAAAHNNLAAIYISQEPPLVELARWHYQKALEAGQPHNPELEKALAEKGAMTTTP